jgi:hypothetical protein
MKVHKVLIIGDSHARNCAANVKADIRDNFEVQELVKPGAGTDILVNSANNDIMSLTKSDVLIFCGGANSVGKKNSTKALQHSMDFIKTNNHTIIILVSVPPRYDLMQPSCVHSEIKSFKRQLKEMVKVYQHTSVLEMDNDRKLFTSHGLHLNGQGKEVFFKLSFSHIFNIGTENRSPSNFKWEIRSKSNSYTKTGKSYK